MDVYLISNCSFNLSFYVLINNLNVDRKRIVLMTAATNKKTATGKKFSLIPNRHKPYFEVDDDNKVTSYRREICIDRVELRARLSQEEFDGLLDHLEGTFESHSMVEKKKSGYILHCLVFDLSREFGIYIKLMPHEKINAEIQLQSKFTNNLQGNSPYILDLLNHHGWFITRLDVATDYTTPFKNSACLKRHGNQTQKNFETSSWIGSTANSKKKAVNSSYDRKVKDASLVSSFTNRFEVKMFFKEEDAMTFANLNHRIIANRLLAELFIPCLTYSYFHERKVKTNRGQREYIDLIKGSKQSKNDNYVKLLLTEAQWKTFRSHFKACRDDIEDLYLHNSHEIYDFLLAHH